MSELLHADNLKELVGVRHGFFTRDFKRAEVALNLGVVPDHLLFVRQIHSATCVAVTQVWTFEQGPEVDALVTNVKGVALGILTADCVPVLFADRSGVVGAAHAGWRGALGGVLENTISSMEKLGAHKRDIRAAIGPCIWQQSYEVGPEFPAPFLAENPVNEKFFRPAFKSDHYQFDLPGYVYSKLEALGLRDVEPSPADTFSDESWFFSYRRGCLTGAPESGRLISAIVLP